MTNSPLPAPGRPAERVWIAANHLVALALIVCALVPAVRLGERLAPGWDGGYLLIFGAGVALEALLAERFFRARFPATEMLRVWLYRLLEIAALLIALWFVQMLRGGLAELGAGLVAFVVQLGAMLSGRADIASDDLLRLPEAGGLNSEFVFGALFVVGVWSVAGGLAASLLALEGDARLFEHKPEAQIPSERREASRRLFGQVVALGAATLTLTALLRQDLAQVGVRTPASSGGLFNLLLFFSLGLLLLSQSRFAVLRAQWGLERIAVRPGMAWSWAGYTLLLLLAVDVVAGLLPTGYSFGLLNALGAVLGGLFAALQFLIYLLVWLFAWLAHWLASLFQPASFAPMTPPPPLATPPPFNAAPPVEALAPNAPGRAVVVWVIFLVIFALTFFYLSRRPPDFTTRELPQLRWRAWLEARLRGLAAFWRRARRGAQALIAAGVGRWRPPAPPALPWRYLNLRRLSPREQVRFYYAALLRRAREAGLARRPGQTPFEYERDLRRALPDEAEALAALTAAFVEARYSPRAVDPPQARQARGGWEALRAALRRRRP